MLTLATWVSTAELDLNMFFDDNLDFNPATELESNFVFDSSSSCDLTSLGETQLFGKVRRETSCKTVEGQTQKPSNPGQNDPFDFNQFSQTEAVRIFPKLVEICPTYMFGTSNIPVCKDVSNGDIIRVPGLLPVTLLNVQPCTSVSSFFLFF